MIIQKDSKLLPILTKNDISLPNNHTSLDETRPHNFWTEFQSFGHSN